MGLFSNLKNMVSGGSAEVKIENTEFKHNQPNKIEVAVHTKDADVKADSVYFDLKCEHVSNTLTISLVDTNQDNVKDKIKVEIRNATNTLYTEKIELQKATILQKNQAYHFEKDLDVKNNFIPSSQNVKWKCLAGVSTFGNDPDSGWIDASIALDFKEEVNNEKWSLTLNINCLNTVFIFTINCNYSYQIIAEKKMTISDPEFGFIVNNDALYHILEAVFTNKLHTVFSNELKKLNDTTHVHLLSTKLFEIANIALANSEINQLLKLTDFYITEVVVKDILGRTYYTV